MVSEPLASEIALDPVDEALDDIGDFFEEAWDDTRDFIKDHPIISGALAIATGTWFISAAGGLAAAGAKLATGITNVIGSFTPTISSTSIGASINVGSFASASVGAGVNGLTAFAGANVSILGVPVWGVGSSLSALGSFGTTIGGSITNNLLGGPSLFGSGGSIDVGSFAKATVNSTLTVLANESGLTTVHDAFHATRETAQDIYRALAPPPPPVIMQPVSYGASGLTPVEGTPDLQSVGPTGGNPFAGLEDWPGLHTSEAYYESGFGDSNGFQLVGHNEESQAGGTEEEESWNLRDSLKDIMHEYVRDPIQSYFRAPLKEYLEENLKVPVQDFFEELDPYIQDGRSGARSGADVMGDFLVGGTNPVIHERASRAYQEAIDRGDTLTLFAFGAGRVGVMAAEGVVAAPIAAAGSTLLPSWATGVLSAGGTGLGGVVAVDRGMAAYDSYQSGDQLSFENNVIYASQGVFGAIASGLQLGRSNWFTGTNGTKSAQTTQLYSYFDGAVDTTRPFTSSSGRVYLSSHAPGAWLTERGALASARRFIRTGRVSPYSSADNFFTTGPINPAEWGLKPILPRTANFWKRLGGQYHTSIGTSGFELASPGSRILTNSPIPSTSSQIWQAQQGLIFESTADVLIIGNGIYRGNEIFGGSND